MLLIERVGALQQSPIFATLNDHVLSEVAQIVEEITYQTGEYILRQGESGTWMCVLIDGSATVEINGENKTVLHPGSTLGELAVLDPAPRSASIVANEPCLVFRIDREPFQEVMLEQPEVMSALLMQLARMIRQTVTESKST